MTVDHDFQRRWLAALRSGEYRQGQGYMRTNQGYCCQGVACDLLEGSWKPDSGVGWRWWRWSTKDGVEGSRYYWPDDVAEALGLDYDDGRKLANMNDCSRPFADIADKAEELMWANGTHPDQAGTP